MDRALFHIDNCYNIANLTTTGRMCHTNLPSNTAFRGFGAPQAMLVIETCVAQVAAYLDMAPEQVNIRHTLSNHKHHHVAVLVAVYRLQQTLSIPGSLLPFLRSIIRAQTRSPHRLVGLVVRRPPRMRKIRGSNPARDGIFLGRVIPVTQKLTLQWLTLPGAWRYRVSAGTGRPDVSIL